MITTMMVGGVTYLSNEWLRARGRTPGAYTGTERINRSNMQWLRLQPYQDLEWVDFRREEHPPEVEPEYIFYYEPVGTDAAVVNTDILYMDDPLTENKLCFLEQTLYDSYQATWDGDGILDQTTYDDLKLSEYQSAWPNHDSNLDAFLYGEVKTKADTMTAAQRYTAYNQGLVVLGLEVAWEYNPPRGPIEEAVHEYARQIMAF